MPIKFCFIIICIFSASVSFAAIGPEQLQKRLNEEAEQTLMQRRVERSLEAEKSGNIPSASVQEEATASDVCLQVDTIAFYGAKNINIKKIEQSTKKLTCISQAALRDIQKQLQMLYVQKGYITARVYFDIKDLNKREIGIVIEEGFLENIIMLNAETKEEDTALAARLQKATAFPFAEGNVLNLKDIEQGVEQMNKLASNNITMQIRPGDTVGASVIILDNQQLPKNTFGLSYDNNGTESTGKNRATASFSRDNLLSLNDNLYFSANSTVGDGGGSKYSRGASGSITIPFGYLTFTDSLNYSRYLNTTKGITTDIESRGTYINNLISAEYLFARGENYKTSLGVELSVKQSKNYIEDVYIDVSSRTLSTLSVYLSGTYFGKIGVLFSKLSINQGLPAFGAKKDNAETDAPKAQFTTLALYVNYSKELSPFTYLLTADGQYSFDYLFASEQVMIGGGVLRGFRESNAYGEHGFTIKQEVRAPLANLIGRSSHKLIDNALTKLFTGIFVDYGYVKPKDNTSASSAASGGVKLAYYSKYFYGGATWGRSFYRTDDIEDEGSIVNLNMGINILF